MWGMLKVNHMTTTPYHPQTNAQAEVFNKTMTNYLKKVISQAEESSVHWEQYLGPLMISHNTAVHKATMTTPFYTMFGYDPRMPFWPEGELLENEETWPSNPLLKHRETQKLVRAGAKNSNQHYREQYSRQYNKDNKVKLAAYHKGQNVWVQLHANNEANKKLADKWEEGEILEQCTEETYKVLRRQRKRRRAATINVYHLKPMDMGEDNMLCDPPIATPAARPAGIEAEESESSGDEEEEDDDSQPDDDSEEEQYIPTKQQLKGEQHQGSSRVTRSRAKAAAHILAISALLEDEEDDQICEVTENLLELLLYPTEGRRYRLMNMNYNLHAGGGGGAPTAPPVVQQQPDNQRPAQQGQAQAHGQDQLGTFKRKITPTSVLKALKKRMTLKKKVTTPNEVSTSRDALREVDINQPEVSKPKSKASRALSRLAAFNKSPTKGAEMQTPSSHQLPTATSLQQLPIKRATRFNKYSTGFL
jgi:hypothetical protein